MSSESRQRELPPIQRVPVPAGDRAVPAREVTRPLGIGHLMLWTAGVAVILALGLATRPPGPPLQLSQSFFLMTGSLLGGAGLAGLAVLVGRWRAGGRLAPQPGHWLLAILGVGALLFPLLHYASVWGAIFLFGAHQGYAGHLFAMSLFAFAASVGYFWAYLRLVDYSRWRWVFLLAGLGEVFRGWIHSLLFTFLVMGGAYGGFAAVEGLRFLFTLALLLVLASLALSPRAPGERFDWLHHVGVWTHILAWANVNARLVIWALGV